MNTQPRVFTFGTHLSTFLVLLALAAGSVGCSFTTPAARNSANKLAVEIGKYKLEQQNRVEQLNAEYHDAFVQLIDAFAIASAASLKQSRDADAQRIADQLTGKSDLTLRQQFRDAFFKTVQENRAQINAADEAIAATSNAYKAAYADLVIEIDKLDKVQQNLQRLAADGDRSKASFQFLRTVYKVYKDLRKKEEEQAAAETEKAAKDIKASTADRS